MSQGQNSKSVSMYVVDCDYCGEVGAPTPAFHIAEDIGRNHSRVFGERDSGGHVWFIKSVQAVAQ